MLLRWYGRTKKLELFSHCRSAQSSGVSCMRSVRGYGSAFAASASAGSRWPRRSMVLRLALSVGATCRWMTPFSMAKL